MQNRVSVGSETEWRQHQQRGSSPVTPRVRLVSSVCRRWPHSPGHRRRHGRHETPHSPALVHSLPLSLSRDSDGGNAIAIVAESSASFARTRPCVSPHLTSERLQVCLKLLHLLHPLVGRGLPEVSRISRIAVVGFTGVTTQIPVNLAAAAFLPPFFPPSHVMVCLGLGGGSCHAIPALVPPRA